MGNLYWKIEDGKIAHYICQLVSFKLDMKMMKQYRYPVSIVGGSNVVC